MHVTSGRSLRPTYPGQPAPSRAPLPLPFPSQCQPQVQFRGEEATPPKTPIKEPIKAFPKTSARSRFLRGLLSGLMYPLALMNGVRALPVQAANASPPVTVSPPVNTPPPLISLDHLNAPFPLKMVVGVSEHYQTEVVKALNMLDPALKRELRYPLKSVVLGPSMASMTGLPGVLENAPASYLGRAYMDWNATTQENEIRLYLAENNYKPEELYALVLHELGHAVHYIYPKVIYNGCRMPYDQDVLAIREQIRNKSLPPTTESLLKEYLIPHLYPDQPSFWMVQTDQSMESLYSAMEQMSVSLNREDILTSAQRLLDRPLWPEETSQMSLICDQLDGRNLKTLFAYGAQNQLTGMALRLYEQLIVEPVKESVIKGYSPALYNSGLSDYCFNEAVADSIAWLHGYGNYGTGNNFETTDPMFMFRYFPRLVRSLSYQLGLPLPEADYKSLAVSNPTSNIVSSS